ncbi:MAG: hypothetical protein ABII00_12915 [Elusimicrobiota bacterium]
MRRVLLLLLAGALASAWAGCSGGRLKVGATKDGEVVEAEGWAPIDENDPLGTKKRSLVEAQKKAVERVVGVFISAKTRVSEAVTVDQNILANVEGYLKKYEVLSEREEEGFHKTRIRALVLYKKVGEDLKSLGLMRPQPPPGNPKVVVLIATHGEWSESKEGQASGAVRRSLLERGFRVVDRNDTMRFGGRKSTDTATAMEVGQDLRADLVVKGEAQAYPLRDVRLGGFHSYRARVALEVLKPRTAEVLTRKVVEASALDPAPEIAEAKALENAGMLAGEALASELSELLAEQVSITLRVLGLKGLAEVQRLSESLRLQPDIVSVTLSDFRKAGAELTVTTEGLAGDELAALLLRMKKYSLRIRAVTPYVVEVGVGE